MSIIVTLTSYNMGPETTQEDFQAWVDFVVDFVRSTGLENVTVEAYGFGQGPSEDTIKGAEDGGAELRECLQKAWFAFCESQYPVCSQPPDGPDD